MGTIENTLVNALYSVQLRIWTVSTDAFPSEKSFFQQEGRSILLHHESRILKVSLSSLLFQELSLKICGLIRQKELDKRALKFLSTEGPRLTRILGLGKNHVT